MILFTIGFLLGDVWLQTFATLPHIYLLFFVSTIVVACCWSLPKVLQSLILGICCGLVFTSFYAHKRIDWQLPAFLENVPLQAIGTIASIPVVQTTHTSFLFQIQSIFTEAKNYKVNQLARLSWRAPITQLAPGQTWSLKMRLKRIHGNQSFGVFDYEQWALQQGLRLQGYVIDKMKSGRRSALLLSGNSKWHYIWLAYRQYILSRIKAILPTSKTAHWLPALMVGERQAIPSEQWDILRLTGTNHLMAIAGLHIGILALLSYKLITIILRRYAFLLLIRPRNEWCAVAVLIIAAIYSALAGFSIPTQRACCMLAIVTAAVCLRTKINAWRVWATALLIVLIINPLVTLSESFWLSFGTIAIIIFGMRGRLKPQGWWWAYGRIQWIIGIGLIPLTLIFFHQIAWFSFIANSIAIPFLSFLILPFCLLSLLTLLVSDQLATWWLILADKNLSTLWLFLTWIAKWPLAKMQFPTFSWLQYAMLTFGVFISLLPLHFRQRFLSLFFILPIFLIQPAKPERGNYWLTMLDVGQGLSIVVQTQNHLLVYDTGPKYQDNTDMGERVVLPFLHQLGYPTLDTLILSHGDNDHIGGFQSIKKAINIQRIYSSVPKKLATDVMPCIAGMYWQWDKIHFTFLHPPLNFLPLGNDSSCVLQIDNGKVKTLITGDIEKRAEKYLWQQGLLTKVDLLIAPHHGSKTSASKAFVQNLLPKYVLYGTGYKNQYRFPHPQVVAAYKSINAKQFSTAKSGSLQFKIQDKLAPPVEYRLQYKRYWHIEMTDVASA